MIKKLIANLFRTMRPIFNQIVFIAILIIIPFIDSSFAQIYVSDHFDSQSEWDGSGDPPKPWSGWLTVPASTQDISGNWDDAHGSSGKSYRISWPDQILEVGLATYAASGKSEIWVGFLWRHSSNFDMGPDNQDKWIYFPEVGGERNMISHKDNTLAFFNGSSYSCKVQIGTSPSQFPNTGSSAWYNDTAWHRYIMYISPINDTVKIWRDGTELEWDCDNTNIGFRGKAFDSGQGMIFGYQSRNGWSGNQTFFDDIIIASTKAEVENFLGSVAGNDNDDTSNEFPVANCGDDQTILDTNGDGIENVVLDASGSYDPDGQIISYQWKEGDVVLDSGPTATVSLDVGTHNITLYVADDLGNIDNDSCLVDIKSTSSPTNSQTLLLEEAFEDNNLSNYGWYDISSQQAIVYDTVKNSNVLEVEYKIGQATAVNGSIRHLFTETDDLYFSYDVRYQNNWIWTGKNYGPHEFNFLTNLDHSYKGPALTHCTTYVETVNGIPRIGFQDGLNVATDKIGQDLTNITEYRSVFGCNGDSDGYSSDSCFESGGIYYNGKHWSANTSSLNLNQWHHIETYIKMNSISNNKGLNDGILKMWINGVLKVSYEDVLIRTDENSNMKFNQIVLGPYYHGGAPQNQKFWIDNIVVKSNISMPFDQRPSTVKGLRIAQ